MFNIGWENGVKVLREKIKKNHVKHYFRSYWKTPTTHDQNKNEDLINNADTITETMSKIRNLSQRMKTELQIQFRTTVNSKTETHNGMGGRGRER